MKFLATRAQTSSRNPMAGIQRALIALVQVLGLTVWFSASAVVPSLRQDWGIGPIAAVWLTASVQVGFVVGAVGSAVLNLPDRIRPHRLLAANAFAAAVCTVILAVTVDSIVWAIPLRFLTGMFLAGVYPVGLKLMASWAASAGRGRSLGLLVGSLTLGSALPHLISGIETLPWNGVMAAAAAITATGAAISFLFVRPGPHLDTRPIETDPRYVVRMFSERGPRLVNLGYFGHMWELYALWTWLPAYLTASRAGGDIGSHGVVEVASFISIGIAGVTGCILGGVAADRYGRSKAASVALTISGLCCLLAPLFFETSAFALFTFVVVWGAAVIADSGVFSTALSETVDSRYTGTALTVQTAVGFSLTVVTIQFVPIVANLVTWQYAFLILAPGPIVGVAAMARFSDHFEKKTFTKEES